MSRRDYVTRDEFQREIEAWAEDLIKSLVDILAPAGSAARRAAQQRAAELRQTDPVLADQVASVAKARQDGLHVTFGSDAGVRGGPGDIKIGGGE